MKITDLKCPGCGSTLKMPAGNVKTVQCKYCGNEYIIDSERGLGQGLSRADSTSRRIPEWEPLQPESRPASVSSRGTIAGILVSALCIALIAGLFVYQRTREENRQRETQPALSSLSAALNSNRRGDTGQGEDTDTLSGMLGSAAAAAFGKDAGSVTKEELSQIQWIADRRDLDGVYIGYSFENPLENPDAELTWLTFPSGSESGYSGLYMFAGLKKLDTRESLSQCNLRGLSLESLTAPFKTLQEAAGALDNPSALRQLVIGSQVKSLEGLELFPNLESLIIDAINMSNVNEAVSLEHLKSITLEDADAMSDFSVFASMNSLEELNIESENLKSLDFLKRMPQLKGLGLADGKLLNLDGIEALNGLERLSVTDCRELKNMNGISSLTGLKELTLELPYGCEEPSFENLTGLQSLTLEGFTSCGFLSYLTGLEELTLHRCDVPSGVDLSGLTRLRKLTCTTFYQDRSLDFVSGISSLEYVDLSGMVTYGDISGVFALPNIKELKLSAIQCEIDFDRITDNSSLETLEMAGVKLYENVSVSGYGGFVQVDWDDVYLADHLDFFRHFPNLKKLDITDNDIADLSFVQSLVHLEEIDFSDNYVTDVHILASLPVLRLVDCKGNPVSNLRVLDDLHIYVINE